jgi:hypothetical protein
MIDACDDVQRLNWELPCRSRRTYFSVAIQSSSQESSETVAGGTTIEASAAASDDSVAAVVRHRRNERYPWRAVSIESLHRNVRLALRMVADHRHRANAAAGDSLFVTFFRHRAGRDRESAEMIDEYMSDRTTI